MLPDTTVRLVAHRVNIENLVDRQLISKGYYIEKRRGFFSLDLSSVKRTEKFSKTRKELSDALYKITVSECDLDDRTAFILSFCSPYTIFSISKPDADIKVAVEAAKRKLQSKNKITSLVATLKELVTHVEHTDYINRTNPGKYTGIGWSEKCWLFLNNTIAYHHSLVWGSKPSSSNL